MLKYIDKLLDSLTMYHLLLYYLGGLIAAALIFSMTGAVHFSPIALLGSVSILLAACWGINIVLAYLFGAPTNGGQSARLTALILALIITPDISKLGIVFLLAAAGLAMASKYILAINRKHIFNPAAIAVLLTGLGATQTASWWVGSSVMLPFVVVGGLLLLRKLRHSAMVVSFLITTTIVTAVLAWLNGSDVPTNLHYMIFSSAVFFLGFVMLTEPMTSPTQRSSQIWYGFIVGALLPPQVHLLGFYTSPELALVIGNLFAYIVSPKVKLFPVLKQKIKIATNTADFVFYPEKPFAYEPGQYMEWTLPHMGTDFRGSRRYFTLASSPTEPELRIGVKFYDQGSSYKQAMLEMDQRTPVVAAQLAGDFILTKDITQKLAFIAGGIGVTPFRSMTKYLTDTNDHRDVTMLYAARTRADVAYAPIFEAARQKLGMQTVYVLNGEPVSSGGRYERTGVKLSAELIKQEIPDYRERLFYLSGTHDMVMSVDEALRHLGVPRTQIKTDFFPGYV